MRPIGQALAEALRSLTATPKRFGLVLVVIVAASALLTVREATFVDDLRSEQRQRIAQGEQVHVVSVGADAVSARGVPGAGCDALRSVPGIVAAGVEAEAGNVTIGGHPDGSYRAVDATPGMLALLGRTDEPSGAVLGSATAGELGKPDGALVQIGAEVVTVGVLDASGARTALLDRAVITVRPPPEVTGTCYVEVGGLGPEEAALLLPALLSSSTSDPLSVSPLLDRAELGTTPKQKYDDRPDTWLWLVLALLTVVPWLLLVRARRGDLGCYAMFGGSPAWVTLVLAAEWIILALVGAAAGVVALAWMTAADGGAVTPALAVLGRYLIAVVLIGTLVSATVPLAQTRVYETLRRTE